MKKTFALGLACFLASSVFAQTEYGLKFSNLINDNLTLENAIRLGLENNSEFLVAKQEIIIAEQRVNEAKFRYLPQISLQGTATAYDLDYPMVLPDSVANRFLPSNSLLDDRDQFYGVGVTATQYIYSGGRINGTLKLARANLKQVQSHYESVKNNVVLSIKKTFTNLLHAQHELQLAKEINETAQKWYTQNTNNVWDKIKRQALMASFQSRQNEAENLLKKAELAMLVSLNKELNSHITVTGNFEPIQTDWDLPRLNLWATEFRPEMKSARYALEVNSIAIDLALSKQYPDLILTGSYEKLGAESLNDVNKQISLALRLPIPYNISTQITQKKAERKQSELRRAAMEDKIKVQVAESFEDMRFWQTEVLNRQKSFHSLEALFKQAKNVSKTGTAPLEALKVYQETAKDYLEAVRQTHLAKASLEWAIGQDLQ